MVGRRILGVVLGGVVLFGAGIAVGAYTLGGAGEAPCWQVQTDVQAAQDTLAETFGSGEAGRAAMQQLLDVAQERPDCFSPATQDMLRAGLDADEPSGADDSSEGVTTESES